jgi:hypothetical protein
MASKLCGDCSNLLAATRPIDSSRSTSWIRTKHKFHDSARNGCAMCNHILLGFSERESSTLQHATIGNGTTGISSIDFQLVNSFVQNAELFLTIKIYFRMPNGLRTMSLNKSYAIHPMGDCSHLLLNTSTDMICSK